jgi:hypothetical protein
MMVLAVPVFVALFYLIYTMMKKLFPGGGLIVIVLGVGVIVRGESGIGKSESVLALIERGYSLVSDDITKVMLIDGREVMGTSADLTRNPAATALDATAGGLPAAAGCSVEVFVQEAGVRNSAFGANKFGFTAHLPKLIGAAES